MPLLLAFALAGACWAMPGPSHLLRLRSGTFDPLRAGRTESVSGGGPLIVQLDGAGDASTLGRLHARLGPIVAYLPDDAYVFRPGPGALQTARGLPGVRWAGPLLARDKLSPDLGRRTFRDPARQRDPRRLLFVFVVPGSSPRAVAAAVQTAGGRVLRIRDDRMSHRLLVHVPAAAAPTLAALPDVLWIEEVGEMTLRNGTTAWVIQSDVLNQVPVWDHGLHGEGQIIGHIDYPLDLQHCMFADSIPPGPDHAKVVGYRVTTTVPDPHGTHTAGTAAGRFIPTLGSPGMAYAARLSHTDLHLITGFGEQTSNLDEMLLLAHQDGARVHTNSWGDDGSIQYNALSQDIDTFSRANEDDVVVFAATNQSSLRTPENAKDVLAVGASGQSPNQETHCSGGLGPTSDGRRKPEVYAPGCGIVSASAQTECGLTAKSGTSMACAAVAGAAALVRQYYTQGFYPSGHANASDALVPTGALLRATLVNAAVDMSGVPGYPSDAEGFGRLLLDEALHFDGQSRSLLIHDVRNAEGLSTGEAASVCFEVLDAAQPLRVTMAFTDVPAALNAADAAVNDLDLEVEGPGGVYAGNDFANGQSQPGGAPDPKNTVEEVLVPAPAPGIYTIRVKGTAVRMDKQGYAVVATGILRQVQPPEPPTGLDAQDDGNGHIALTWSSVSGAAAYQLLRSYQGCDGAMELIATTPDSLASDTTVSGGIDVSYRVRSLAPGCSNAGIPSVCVTTRATGPCTLAPLFEGLESAQDRAAPSCSVHLSWPAAGAPCGGTARYNIYRSADPEFVPAPENRIVTCQSIQTFDDLYGLDSGVALTYVVRAEDPTIAGSGACGGREEPNLQRRTATPFGPGFTERTLQEHFEAGLDGWSADESSLWHLVQQSACVPPGYSSAAHAWYFGQDDSCTYNTGGVASGTLISPSIGPLTASSTLSFAYFRQVESFTGVGDYDVTSVAAETQGNVPQVVWQQTAATPSSGTWQHTAAIPLAGFDGQLVRLRFTFNSGDAQNNRFAGWAIDDVQVSGTLEHLSCGRAELPPPEIAGTLVAGFTDVGVRFVLPRASALSVYSTAELLGSGVSDDVGFARVGLNRPLAAGESVHAESLGRVGPAVTVTDAAELGAGSGWALLVVPWLALGPAVAARRRRSDTGGEPRRGRR